MCQASRAATQKNIIVFVTLEQAIGRISAVESNPLSNEKTTSGRKHIITEMDAIKKMRGNKRKRN